MKAKGLSIKQAVEAIDEYLELHKDIGIQIEAAFFMGGGEGLIRKIYVRMYSKERGLYNSIGYETLEKAVLDTVKQLRYIE